MHFRVTADYVILQSLAVLANYVSTLSDRLTILKSAKVGHGRKEAKFGQNQSTLSTRFMLSKERQTDRQIHAVERKTDRQTDRRVDGRRDERTDGWTDGRTRLLTISVTSLTRDPIL